MTTCDKDGDGIKKIMKFVWRNLWMAPNNIDIIIIININIIINNIINNNNNNPLVL